MKRLNCILLVDDNPADNEFHKIIIRKAGVCNQIKMVPDGEAALSYIKKSGEPNQSEEFPKPDLILLDINMPRMNGFEFIMEYQKLDANLRSGVSMAMLTTSLNPEDKKRATNYEIGTFIVKPLTVEMVHKIIEKIF